MSVLPVERQVDGNRGTIGPIPWKVTADEKTVQIVPLQYPPLGMYLALITIFAATMLAAWFLSRSVVPVIVMGCFSVVCLSAVFMLYVRNYQRGPLVVFEKQSQQVHFPRMNRSVLQPAIVAWHEITGIVAFQGNLNVRKTTELNLLVRDHSGQVERIPVIGGMAFKDIHAIGVALAKETGIALRQVQV